MKPTQTLIDEHVLIKEALDSFQKAVHNMEKNENPPPEFFEKMVMFARQFVDEFHHLKEEELMFMRLSLEKENSIDKQLDGLRHQHERGRGHISMIANALEGYARGEQEQATEILDNLSSYTSLLKIHIHQEDNEFFPMVDKEFSPEDHEELVVLFQKEDEKFGPDFLENHRKLVADMAGLV